MIMTDTAFPGSAGLKALLFDVQGTATDFRGTIIREGAAINRRKGLDLDWGALADDWRGRYRPALDAILGGRRAWCSVDLIYREALEEVLRARGITVFGPQELDDLTRVWHRLDPWPDTVPGLLRLRQRYILATLSNADMAAVVRMARHSHLPWDVVLSGELVASFKPDPRVYQMAVRYLGVAPGEILMVAAHKYDLRAAREQGFRTAFVARPLEFGPEGQVDTAYEAGFDLNVGSFTELAERLGV